MSEEDWIPRWQLDSYKLNYRTQQRKTKGKQHMSPVIDFSNEDLLRGKIVEPGWYILDLGTLSEAVSGKGDSTNWVFDARIVSNSETGSTEFAGVPVAVRFNSKAKGFMVGFLAALKGDEVQAGERFELKSCEGKKIIGNVINDTYDGRIVNKVDHKYKTYKG